MLRNDVYLNVGVLADRYAAESGDAAFRQVARCARAHLIDANLELERIRLGRPARRQPGEALPGRSAGQRNRGLAAAPGAAVGLAIEPRSRIAIALLGTRAIELSQPRRLRPTRANDRADCWPRPPRPAGAWRRDQRRSSSRCRPMIVTGKPPAAERRLALRCRSCTTAARAQNGAADAANLQALLRPDQPPATLNDQQAAFESLLRLSMAAETKEQYDDMGRLASRRRSRCSAACAGSNGTPCRSIVTRSMSSRRTRSQDLGTLARSDPAFGARTLATYTGLYETLLKQAQNQFVGDCPRAGVLPVQDRQQPARSDRALPGHAALAGGDCRLDLPARAAAFLRTTDACDTLRRAGEEQHRPGRATERRALLHDDDSEQRLPARPPRVAPHRTRRRAA